MSEKADTPYEVELYDIRKMEPEKNLCHVCHRLRIARVHGAAETELIVSAVIETLRPFAMTYADAINSLDAVKARLHVMATELPMRSEANSPQYWLQRRE